MFVPLTLFQISTIDKFATFCWCCRRCRSYCCCCCLFVCLVAYTILVFIRSRSFDFSFFLMDWFLMLFFLIFFFPIIQFYFFIEFYHLLSFRLITRFLLHVDTFYYICVFYKKEKLFFFLLFDLFRYMWTISNFIIYLISVSNIIFAWQISFFHYICYSISVRRKNWFCYNSFVSIFFCFNFL